MAPLHRQQTRAIPPPRPPKGPPAIPVPVKTLISGKVFFLLFLGTACIFVIGIFFWKIGAIVRFFTQDRVLREGKPATTRYARTWYGWVPLSRHKANKRVLKRRFRTIRGWITWKSSHADYRWVWWDPGLRETERHYDNQKALRWLPKWAMSYEFPTADSIWNPGPLPANTEAENDTEENHRPHPAETQIDLDRHTVMAEGRQTYSQGFRGEDNTVIFGPSSVHQHTLGKSNSHHICDKPFMVAPVIYPAPSLIFPCQDPIQYNRRVTVPLGAKQSEVPFQAFQAPKDTIGSADCQPTLRRTVSLPSMAELGEGPEVSCPRSDLECQDESSVITQPVIPKETRLSRKYKVWAARMQIKTFDQSTPRPNGLSGRPGSPLSELLNSISSEQSAYSTRFGGGSWQSDSTEEHPTGPTDRAASNLSKGASFGQSRVFGSSPAESNARPTGTAKPEGIHESYFAAPPRLLSPNVSRVRPPLQVRNSNCFLQCDALGQPTEERRRVTFQGPTDTRIHTSARHRLPFRNLSNPEVRLMYDLDRRLEWLLNELDPGRKPFHFATLANHWLNTETWVVYDPVCRVSNDVRRRYGDPRFNVPFPDVKDEPRRPKYPITPRKRAHTPRIDSWRIAVNKQRKSAGLQDFLKAIKLFDNSADEVPDGKVDPASWILRKPPQGFEMSNKQKNAYWEGGAGWQETLDDWQKVRYGYRIEKAIYEGKVNRTRMKEMARGVTKIYRSTARKLPQTSVVVGWKKRAPDMERERRRTRSGNGSMRMTAKVTRTSLDGVHTDSGAYNRTMLVTATQAFASPAQLSDTRRPLTSEELGPTGGGTDSAVTHDIENG